MPSGLYNGGRAAFLRGEIDWRNADIRQLLVQDTYSFSAAHEFVSDVAAAELGATDYARQQVAGRIVGTSAPTFAEADDSEYPGLGGAVNQTIGGAIYFVHTGNDATARLLCFVDTADIVTQDQLTVVRLAASRVFSWGG